MPITRKVVKSTSELKKQIQTHRASFYFSSQTSTVIPYDKIESYIGETPLEMIDLSQMPSEMSVNQAGNLVIRGAVSWKEANEYLKPQGLAIMTAPTEDLALVLAGVATSCTGERCFKFGNLRSQIMSLKYINYDGEEKSLSSDKVFTSRSSHLKSYQQDFQKYQELKNAPYPRFAIETDLLTGTEGQLGVITEVELKITKNVSVQHLFVLVPKWEEDLAPHLEIQKLIQNFRDSVILCEHIDSNSFNYLKPEERPNQEMDAIFFEVETDHFEHFYEGFITKLKLTKEESIFEISASKFHHLRASIPRAVFEKNSEMGVTKMGTDVQVPINQFKALMDIYKDFSKTKVNYNLFGHFGDAHLHFNFMPTKEQTKFCQQEFERMYLEVKKLAASPFAEHGIGLIKQKFIKNYWHENQYQLFKDLKSEHDPHNQFFPQGFMNLK